MQIREIIEKYGISKATAARLNAAGRADGVPPPWSDPIALQDWYETHYRSDLANIARQSRRIPDWLDVAAFSAPAEKSNRPNERIDSPARKTAPRKGRGKVESPIDDSTESPAEHVVRTASTPAAPSSKPATSAEALDFARRTIADQQVALEKLPADSPARIAGMKKFVELLAQIQMAEKRDMDMGVAREAFMADAKSALRDILGGIKRRLKIDLIVLRKTAVTAGADAESWAEFAGDFLTTSLERSCIERFGLLTGTERS